MGCYFAIAQKWHSIVPDLPPLSLPDPVVITIILGLATWVVSILNLLQFRKGKLQDLVDQNRQNLMEAMKGKWSIED